jgi:hypothetical protein
VPLPQDASSFCEGVVDGETLGDYLALLIAYGALASEAGAPHSLELSCEPGRANLEILPNQIVADADKYWVCALAATVDSHGESPWNYELRFLLSRDDLSVDTKRMWCPGAP